MADRDVRERDILAAPNEYAYVQDLTKGDIVLYVGPTKISLSNTERMTLFRDGRFLPVRGDEAGLGVEQFVLASSSQYIILENPPVDAASAPVKGANSAVALQHGRKIVVPGAAQFPLWPGQRAVVVDGHELQADEYLVVRVYQRVSEDSPPIGTELVIRGTDVSFYMPTTGLEVVAERGAYVRRAIRLRKSQGLHLRALAEFEIDVDELLDPGSYRAGQEIFVREREGHFFPVSNIEVVGIVDRIPLAENEGVYVRRYDSGEITVVEGSKNYLTDPTREEVVLRDLDEESRGLYRVAEDDGDMAVAVYVPPSTAVMVVGKNRREVVIGPQTRILEFNDELERLTLSTGRPKSDIELLPTCFLQIDGNKVSDLVRVRTRDHVELQVLLSYRVSFSGESEKWFAVKDYVGLLCDHLGSIVRAAARMSTIEEFHHTSTEILRTAVLGERSADGDREGRRFSENGMWVYDVEVLEVAILDDEVRNLLVQAQRSAIDSEIARKAEELRLGDQQLRERVEQEIYQAKMATLNRAAEFEGVNRTLRVAQVMTTTESARLERRSEAETTAEARRIVDAATLESAERRASLDTQILQAHATAFTEQMTALSPDLVSTLKTLGNQQMASELSRNLSPLAILGGESVADVAGRLLERLPLGASSAGNGGCATIQSLLGQAGPDAGDSAEEE